MCGDTQTLIHADNTLLQLFILDKIQHSQSNTFPVQILTQVKMCIRDSHDTVTAVREIDIIRAATGRCYMFSHKGIRHSLNDYKELDASKEKTLFAQGDA